MRMLDERAHLRLMLSIAVNIVKLLDTCEIPPVLSGRHSKCFSNIGGEIAALA